MSSIGRHTTTPIEPSSFACRPCGVSVFGYDREPNLPGLTVIE